MRQLQRLLKGIETVRKGDLTALLRKYRGRIQHTINKIFNVKTLYHQNLLHKSMR